VPEVIDVRLTPEEFAEQSRLQAASFGALCRRNAAVGDSIGVLACGWAADVATVQAITAEAILVSGEAPQRLYFQTAESITESTREAWSVAGDLEQFTGVARVLKDGRSTLARSLEPAIVGQLSDAWMELAEFSDIPAPTIMDLSRARDERLGETDPRSFIAARRRESSHLALRAARSLAHGDVESAVREAYAADMYALDGYLVQTALATDDPYLLTVRAWWDLVTDAITRISDLPGDFAASVAVIRASIVTSMGEPAATRLIAVLPRH
jgi:hypothetical protein